MLFLSNGVSDSGIGDHGVDGIKAFVEQHRCNYICAGLKFTPLNEATQIPASNELDSADED